MQAQLLPAAQHMHDKNWHLQQDNLTIQCSDLNSVKTCVEKQILKNINELEKFMTEESDKFPQKDC